MNEEGKSKIQQAIDEAVDSLVESLEKGGSDAMVRFLDAMSRFHKYSLNNVALIYAQKRNATRVAGFHTWKSLGRHVKKGEKAIKVFAPLISKKRKNEADNETGEGEEENPKPYGFIPVNVFDESQTEGKELPVYSWNTLHGDPTPYIPRVEKLISDKGIALEYRELKDDSRAGWSEKGKIVIGVELPLPRRFSVLVHEYSHETLHQKGDTRIDRTREELEAESTAYVVCKYIGLDVGTTHSDYIALYGGNKEMLLESLERIREVANEVINYIEQGGIKQC